MAFSTSLVGKHCSKLGNGPFSRRVAAAKFPENPNLEQSYDIIISHTSFKITDFPSSELAYLGLCATGSSFTADEVL